MEVGSYAMLKYPISQTINLYNEFKLDYVP